MPCGTRCQPQTDLVDSATSKLTEAAAFGLATQLVLLDLVHVNTSLAAQLTGPSSVFVLAVNRAELVHSVKALYGSGFCAERYLRRFFDLDFQLLEPGRERFVQELL